MRRPLRSLFTIPPTQKHLDFYALFRLHLKSFDSWLLRMQRFNDSVFAQLHRDLTALPNKPASAAMCAAIHRAAVFAQRTKLLALCARDRALCSVMLAVLCAQAYCWFVVLVAGAQLRHWLAPGTRNKLPGDNNWQRTPRK